MGCCLSKNGPSSSSLPSAPAPAPNTAAATEISKPSPLDLQNTKTFTTQLDNNTKSTVESGKLSSNKDEKPVKEEDKATKKKEIFVIQHRKSNDKRPDSKPLSDSDISDPCTDTKSSPPPPSEISNKSAINGGVGSNILAAAANGQPVRTSSCTKEEVDAILIQCGRLSRSSSGRGNSGVGGSSDNRSLMKYSGSKRSHDFDKEIGDLSLELSCEADDERQRRRQSRGSHSRRRTPSRSRERDQQQQRSGSRERGSGTGGGRRVSRSPGRRSESPITTNGNATSSNSSNSNTNKPAKMVSVPATVSNLPMNRSNNGGDGVQRVLVKRNVGGDSGAGVGVVGSRNVASPRRSRSPAARAHAGKGAAADESSNNNNQQQPSISRNSSRRAEHSPYRRAPLNEIDANSMPFQPLPSKPGLNNKLQSVKNKEIEEVLKQPFSMGTQAQISNNGRAAVQGIHRRSRSRGAEGVEINYCRVNDHQPSQAVEDNDGQLKPQGIVRSRSLRRSRDLDVDALLNPNPSSYNSLLLQDIQKFHHNKNNGNANNGNSNANTQATNSSNPNNNAFTLPACVTKACSILEAVADPNSSTNSGFSSSFADENSMQRSPIPDLCSRKDGNYSIANSKSTDHPDVVESQVHVDDDLTEPSFHKYVTVRHRDTTPQRVRAGELEEVESSGSNSVVGSGQQHWISSSSWEPNSADSTDCWTSRSSSNTRIDDKLSTVGFHRITLSENVCKVNDMESHKKLGNNRREVFDCQKQNETVRAKAGSGKGVVRIGSVPLAAAAADAASM